MSAKVSDRVETCSFDSPLHSTSDLTQCHTITYEFCNGVPCGLTDLYKLRIAAGTYLDRTGCISDKTIEYTATIDFNNISDLEDSLVIAPWSSVCCYLVPADVTGESELTSMLADVSLHLLSHIVQLDTGLTHRVTGVQTCALPISPETLPALRSFSNSSLLSIRGPP